MRRHQVGTRQRQGRRELGLREQVASLGARLDAAEGEVEVWRRRFVAEEAAVEAGRRRQDGLVEAMEEAEAVAMEEAEAAAAAVP